MPTITLESPEVKYLAERDYRLCQLMNYIGDLEYNRPESAFRSLVHSVIEQMLSIKAGHTIESRLVDICAGMLIPERIIALSLQEIKSCGMSMQKAEALHALARYALSNDLELLRDASEETIYASLMRLPRIGKWTCDMFMLFYLNRPDILPIEDGALRQAFRWLYGAQITDPTARKIVCELWKPYSSTAVRYLYRSLNLGLVKDYKSSQILSHGTFCILK